MDIFKARLHKKVDKSYNTGSYYGPYYRHKYNKIELVSKMYDTAKKGDIDAIEKLINAGGNIVFCTMDKALCTIQ